MSPIIIWALDIEHRERGRWLPGTSGNPAGGKRREQSIAGLLRKKLDRAAFCDHLIGLAMRTVLDTPHNTQSAGLPHHPGLLRWNSVAVGRNRKAPDRDRPIRRCSDLLRTAAIDVTPQQVEVGRDSEE